MSSNNNAMVPIAASQTITVAQPPAFIIPNDYIRAPETAPTCPACESTLDTDRTLYNHLRKAHRDLADKCEPSIIQTRAAFRQAVAYSHQRIAALKQEIANEQQVIVGNTTGMGYLDSGATLAGLVGAYLAIPRG